MRYSIMCIGFRVSALGPFYFGRVRCASSTRSAIDHLGLWLRRSEAFILHKAVITDGHDMASQIRWPLQRSRKQKPLKRETSGSRNCWPWLIAFQERFFEILAHLTSFCFYVSLVCCCFGRASFFFIFSRLCFFYITLLCLSFPNFRGIRSKP